MSVEITQELAVSYTQYFLTTPPERELVLGPGIEGPIPIIGGFTIKGLELLAALRGVSKKDRRPLASGIYGLVKEEGLNIKIFGVGSGSGIVRSREEKLNNAQFISRTEFPRDYSIKRYLTFEAQLSQVVQAKEASERAEKESKKPTVIKESKKQKLKKEKLESKEEQEVHARVNFISYQGSLSSQERVLQFEQARQQLDKNARVIEIEDLTANVKDPTLRFLHLEDIRTIVRQGISREQLQRIFPKLRQQFLKSAQEIEDTVDKIVQQLIGTVKEKNAGSKKSPYVLTYAQKFLAPLIARAALGLLPEEEAGQVAEDTSEDNVMGFNDCIYHELLLAWHCRFEPSMIESYRDELQKSKSPVATQLVSIAERDQHLLRQLKKQGKIEFNGEEITLEDADQLFLAAMLNDENLYKIIFNDVLGVIYATPFTERGYNQVKGLYSLRVLASLFNTQEIEELLAPTAGNIPNIKDIRDEITRRQKEIEQVKSRGGKGRKELEMEIGRLKSMATKAVEMSKHPENIMIQRVRQAVDVRMPQTKPELGENLTREAIVYGAYMHLNTRPDQMMKPDLDSSLIKRMF